MAYITWIAEIGSILFLSVKKLFCSSTYIHAKYVFYGIHAWGGHGLDENNDLDAGRVGTSV